MASKRQVPSTLKAILNIDREATNKFVKFVDNRFGPLSKHRPLMKGLEISCHGIPWFSISAAAVFFFEGGVIRQLALNIFLALIIDIVIVAILKAATRRRRPAGNIDDMFVTYAADKFSFPSGHATRAIMLAFLLPMKYNLFFPLSIMMLSWSFAVCLSRILMKRHHLLDVVLGMVIGVVDALFISNFTWLSVESSQAVVGYFIGGTHAGSSSDE